MEKYNWFAAKVSTLKMLENGTEKKVTEHYLVDAVDYTEAEKRIIEEITPYAKDMELKDLKHRHYVELFESGKDADDKYYEVKCNFCTLDEKTMATKKTPVLMLVQAMEIRTALRYFDEGMKGTMVDYEVVSIKETPIIDIFKHK